MADFYPISKHIAGSVESICLDCFMTLHPDCGHTLSENEQNHLCRDGSISAKIVCHDRLIAKLARKIRRAVEHTHSQW